METIEETKKPPKAPQSTWDVIDKVFEHQFTEPAQQMNSMHT